MNSRTSRSCRACLSLVSIALEHGAAEAIQYVGRNSKSLLAAFFQIRPEQRFNAVSFRRLEHEHPFDLLVMQIARYPSGPRHRSIPGGRSPAAAALQEAAGQGTHAAVQLGPG